MTIAVDVEHLVREVLARLAAETAARTASVTTQGVSSTISTTLKLDDRVISATLLQGRLKGIKQLQIAAKAILTPAARDLLNQHRVELQRGTASTISPEATNSSLVLGVVETNFETSALLKALTNQKITVEQLARSGWKSVISELTTTVARDGRWGLLLTSAPAIALCAANRVSGVRACRGQSVAEVQHALKTFAANLLIVDPATVTYFSLKQMSTLFAQTGTRTMLPAYQSLLSTST